MGHVGQVEERLVRRPDHAVAVGEDDGVHALLVERLEVLGQLVRGLLGLFGILDAANSIRSPAARNTEGVMRSRLRDRRA
jgi:hypothetical protein